MELSETFYQSLYHFLLGEADCAITELQKGEYTTAQMRLQAAVLRCEELYLEATEP